MTDCYDHTLLIIDDTAVNLAVVADFLESRRCRVAIAQDGEEGLQRAVFVKPDLILLDIKMPGMDGFEVCRRLKQNLETSDIPVIFMTALDSMEQKIEGFSAGCVDYLTKPIQVDELHARVATHLKLRQMQKQLADHNRQLQACRADLEQQVLLRTAELNANNALLLQEIEERKRAEKRLSLLDYALNQVGEAAYLIDENARFHYVNDEACRVLGYERSVLLEMGVGDIDPGYSNISWTSAWNTSKLKGAESLLSLHRSREGRVFPVEIKASYFEYNGGSYKLALVRDISDRREIESRLVASERKFRTLAENSPDTIGRYDLACRFLYANSHLQEVFGRSEAEMLGKTPAEFIDVPGARYYQDKIEQVLRTGYSQELILSCLQNGSQRTIHHHVSFVPEFDVGGGMLSVLAIGHDISQLKQVERQLRSLIHNIPDLVVRLDREARHVYVSPNVLRTFDVGEERFLGKTVVEAKVTGDTEKDKQLLEAALLCVREGRSNHMEMELHGEYGSMVKSIIHVPEFNEFGEVETVLAVARDITDRSRMEQELRLREQEFRTLAEHSPDAIVRYDEHYRRVYFNRAYEEALKCNQGAEEVLGKTPLEFWLPAFPTAEEYIERLQAAMDCGEADELLMELIGEKGIPAYRIMFLVPEFDEQGRPLGVLSISHDISDIKYMEAMLRKSEMEFRTLAEHSPDMIIRYDRDCRRIYVNPAYERETGIPLETAWFMTPGEISKPAMSAETYTERLKHVIATGQADRMLFEWEDKHGNLVSYDARVVAEFTEGGEISGVLVVGRNVTDLKNTERRLEESRRQLRVLTAKREEAREEERKRIAREIHDELGQLLNVLRLNATTLDFRFGDANENLRDKLRKMVSTVDGAIRMVRNLATRLRPAVLSAGIVPALDWLVNEYAESTGIVCKLNVLTNELILDEDRSIVVFRIVQESLTNVLRHAEASRVDIFISSANGTCEVEIRDNGKGFDPESGIRGDSYGIVGMHERAMILNGEVDIASVVNVGTSVKLSIPVNDGNDLRDGKYAEGL